MGSLRGFVVAVAVSTTAVAAQPTSMFVALAPTIPGGLTQPVGIANAGDGSNRLFIVEQPGKIRVFENGVLLAAPFIDFGSSLGGLSLISGCTATSCGGERGLLGLTFHPDYSVNGFFYVYYTRDDGDIQISRYQVSAGDPNLADQASATPILRIEHSSQGNHNGGNLMFGPLDGYLYLGTGDGGGGGDPSENAQNLDVLLGKLLRIDIDNDDFPADPDRNYAIPLLNPFSGATAGADEIWAWGLRNPWRWSFDRETHDLYIADVGQGAWEEIDFEPFDSEGGVNYGWDCREGAHPFDQPGDEEDCDSPPFQEPILEYDHGLGCSVTGGFVYRGSTSAAIYGHYFYGDFCTGRIWRGIPAGGGTWTSQELFDTAFNISSWGEDEDAKLYLSDRGGGALYRLTPYSFVDIPPDDAAWRNAEAVFLDGVSLGCASETYCPELPVQRQQIAALLLRASDGATYLPAACPANAYPDVPQASSYCRWIRQLKTREITAGCGSGKFCPTDPVTRGQSAILLLKAVEYPDTSYTPPPCGLSDPFSDVPASDPLCPWIVEAVARGIATGCGPNSFCPQSLVRRDQLAGMLVRTFSLTPQTP
jgi:glucose/arabinose dehydrogenase